jgi:NAD+ synthetase
LGISGGIDSALCAVILKPVCQELEIPLIGRSITIETNSKEEIERSLKIGACFCTDFAHSDITNLFFEHQKLMPQVNDSYLYKLRQGNLKARLRMLQLYDLAQLHQGIVISTDNYTEYLTGFWTLHGDVGDFAPIARLWKTEVFKIAEFLLNECHLLQYSALKSCIEAIPVDGLGISSCDCDQLGVRDYFEADKLFLDYFQGNTSLADHPLIKRFTNSHHKRNNPVILTRTAILK